MDAIQEAIDYLQDKGLVVDPVSLLWSANKLIWEHALIPELDILASDPLDLNFQEVYQAAIFGELVVSNDPDPELASLVTQAIRLQQEVYAYLKAVNVSFDRYVAAYDHGDSYSAVRQSLSFIEYLALYDGKLIEASNGLNDVANYLKTNDLSEFEIDAPLLDPIVDELLANGIPFSPLSLLDDLGLSQEEALIEDLLKGALQDLAQHKHVDLYKTLQQESEYFAGAAQTRFSAVPSPTALSSIVLGLFFFAVIMYWRKQRCGVDRCVLRMPRR